MCLSVVVIINIDAYTCLTLEIVAFAVALICFVVFNIMRVGNKTANGLLRVIWLVPILVCYLPFYIYKKSLIIS